MKRKVYVLDVFTNGHEAALAFVAKEGWRLQGCEIIFCRTHENVLQKLIEGPAYAVVPVRNSIVGKVSEVTKRLDAFRSQGYDLQMIDQLDLQINHCLMAPQHVNSTSELTRVMSHEKAIGQCGKFLDAIGITDEKRSKRDSTGNAAKVVSRLGSDVKIAAIAPKAAAVAYGLKILAENIQDVQDNKTTFQLLENKAEVRPVRVGIVGINGRFGKLLKSFYERIGCNVIGSDVEIDGMSNVEVVQNSDVAIFSIPIDKTPAVIRSLIPHMRPEQLIMDVTSIKRPAVEAMLESDSQVVGLHPMFAPENSFEGQTIVACVARLETAHWKTWVMNMLAATGSKIKWSTPVSHDSYMTTVQGGPHLANLASAVLIAEEGISASASLDFTSPFYRIMFSLMGRLLSQKPDLYAAIALENPETERMLEHRIAIEQRLLKIVREKDYPSFIELFSHAKKHFGADVAKEANELFVRLFSVLKTLYGKNSVTLEFPQAEDHPGLLKRILQVFERREINLTGINSVFLDGRLQFTISFGQSRSSDEIRQALEEIESWEDLKMEVKT